MVRGRWWRLLMLIRRCGIRLILLIRGFWKSLRECWGKGVIGR